MTFKILQILVIILFPAFASWISNKYARFSFLSPIVICFAIGILIRNLNIFPIDEKISEMARDGAILYALPLLLFSSDVKAWLSQSQKTIAAFGLAVLAGVIATSLTAYLFLDIIPEVWKPAGMMMGIHSGGTPNLFAVGYALNTSEEVLTLTNSAQILWGAIYLFFLLSIGPYLIGKFLSGYQGTKESLEEPYLNHREINTKHVFVALAITTFIVLMSVGLSFLFFDNLVSTFIIVFVTTIAILCSFSSKIRKLKGPFEVGDYLLLSFGIAVGMTSDFWVLMSEGGPFIIFVGLIFSSTVIIQVVLFYLFKIDRDTFIIASTATIFGPVFIPQVAQVLKNRGMILGGIAISLLGLALGNYIGLIVAYSIKYLMLA